MGVVTDGYNQVASHRQLSPAILTLNITTSTCCLLVTPLRARDMSPTACCARPVALAFAVEAPNVSLHTRSVGYLRGKLGYASSDLIKYRCDPDVEPPRLLAEESSGSGDGSSSAGDWDVRRGDVRVLTSDKARSKL